MTILSVPMNVHVLTALEGGSMPLADLRRAAGSPPQSTLRKQLSGMTELGILERHEQPGFAGAVDYELARAGRELVQVARVAQNWLRNSPYGPHDLGTQAAKSSIKALVDGWSSTIVRAFAARALALTELDRLIANVTYPTLERRIGAMRSAGQIGVSYRGGRTRPYVVTPWLRGAIAPLAAAIEWERRFDVERAAPVTSLDAESFFLLAVPLLSLRSDLSGTVRLVTQFRNGEGETRSAGAMAAVENGEIRSCVSCLEGRADGWAAGSFSSWLSAAIHGHRDTLEIGGNADLARSTVDGIHERLFQSGRTLEAQAT